MYKRKLSCLIMMLVVVAWLFTPGMGAAENNGADIEKIQPPERFDAGEIDYVEEAKENFAIIGPLDAVYDEHVVINDQSCPLADFADMGGTSVGDFVGAKRWEEHTSELQSLRRT